MVSYRKRVLRIGVLFFFFFCFCFCFFLYLFFCFFCFCFFLFLFYFSQKKVVDLTLMSGLGLEIDLIKTNQSQNFVQNKPFFISHCDRFTEWLFV